MRKDLINISKPKNSFRGWKDWQVENEGFFVTGLGINNVNTLSINPNLWAVGGVAGLGRVNDSRFSTKPARSSGDWKRYEPEAIDWQCVNAE